MSRTAILTFDYEVFLGEKTGTLEKSVIKPTGYILKILKKHNAKAIFFVDATWLLFLKEYFPSDFSLIEEQIKEIVAIGSSVELHLHPQWKNAVKVNDEIRFESFDKYRLHSLNQNEVLKLFKDAIELLESITLQKIKCFRAGGFCIEPFAFVKSAFERFDIKYDFSVLPGMSKSGGNVYDYNFINAPILPIYTFQDDVKMIDPEGSFFEIPLSTYNNNPIYTLAKIVLLTFSKIRVFGDGEGIYEKANSSLINSSHKPRFVRTFLTLDNSNNIFFRYLTQVHLRKRRFLVIISHPKTSSKQSLYNLSYIARKYNTLNTSDLEYINIQTLVS